MNKKLGKFIIVTIGLLTLVMGYFASTLTFDYDFEKFFPADDPDLEYYNEFRERFENDNDFTLIGIRNDEGVFQEAFLNDVNHLSKDIKRISQVTDVTSPTSIESVVITPFGAVRDKYIHLDVPSLIEDSIVVFKHPELVGNLFSENGSTISIYVKYKNRLSKNGADSALVSINESISKYDFDEIHLAGKSVAEQYYIEKMNWELLVFVSASSILIILFLYLSYKSLWGIILPLTVVLLSVIWCMGVMGIFKKPIDLMTVLLPTIMFIVGISDVIHLISKYLEEIRNGADKKTAINTTIKEIGIATFLTSITTAIGFLTLLTASIVTVQEFGLYTAVGVVLAFILSITLLPAILIHLPVPQIAFRKENKTKWNNFLSSLFLWVMRKSKVILIGSFLLTLVFGLGISLVKVDSRIIDEVGEDDPLMQNFMFFEQEFSGVRPFEMNIETEDGYTIFDKPVLKELEKIEAYLKSDFEVGQIVSPLTLVRNMNVSLNGGSLDYYEVPEVIGGKLNKYLRKFSKSSKVRALLTDDLKVARLSGRISDIGGIEYRRREVEFLSFINGKIDASIIQIKQTGSARLIDKSNSYLSKNMLTGLSIAVLLIGLIMGILFRSFKMTVLSLIPNVIPLIMIAGLIGFFNINLNISTSIIFTIAFGIAVDDTIHFLSKFKIELNKGKSVPYAIKRTFLSTGKAIIITSFILMGGFLTLMYSSFNGTFYTGLFISLTLMFAVVADLLLIPSLFLLFYKKGK